MVPPTKAVPGQGKTSGKKNSVTLRDNRTAQEYDLTIERGAIRALDLREVRLAEADLGLLSYDPGF